MIFCKWSNNPSIMNSEGRGFLAQMDHPSTNHSCVFLYWVHCPSRKVLFLHETSAYYQCSGWNTGMTDTSPISPISFVSRKPRFPLLDCTNLDAYKALATRNPVIPSGLFPSSCAHHPIRFKRPWVPETTPPGARCQAPNHPLPPKVADLRCFFGSAMFTKATLDKVSAATCGVRKTCLELPTRSRVSQHLGRGPGAHGF